MNTETVEHNPYNKNKLYCSIGSVVFIDQVSVALERNFYQKESIRFNVKIGAGKLRNGLDLDTNEKMDRKYLTLAGVMHFRIFELQLGAAYREYQFAAGFEPDPLVDYDELHYGIKHFVSIGVRWETSNFLVRAGVGNFELLYAGIGFSF